ncbi:hypothetical protein SAVIM40S_04334 [Streptomyces avidinii]
MLGVVQADPALGTAEAARRPGQHGVPVPREALGLLADIVLAAAETVPEEHGGTLFRTAARSEIGGVDPGTGHGQDLVLAVHRGRVAGRGRGRQRTGARHDGERGGAREETVSAAPGHSELHIGTLKGGYPGSEHPQA